MTISNFVAYVKQVWKNKPDTSTPLSAPRLLHMEDGIKMTSDAIEKIAEAVVSQIVNDPDKIASMAALYAVDQKIGNVANLPNGAADVVTAIAQQNSNLTSIDSRFMSYGFITSLEIDFSALRTGLYLLLTNYEICTVMRYTANIGTKKIVESTLRPITLTEDGYKLTVTSTTSVLLSVLFVGR